MIIFISFYNTNSKTTLVKLVSYIFFPQLIHFFDLNFVTALRLPYHHQNQNQNKIQSHNTICWSAFRIHLRIA